MALRQGRNQLGRWLRLQGQTQASLLDSAKATLGEGVPGDVAGADSGVRYASLLAVKQRMRSVQNIQKITKAMKMVAASKMRQAQAATERSRGMVQPLIKLLGDYPAADVPNNVVVAVTSDKGLCGGINTTISKYTRATLNICDGEGKENSIFVVGEKGRGQLQRDQADKIAATVADTAKGRITFALASSIAEEILKTEFDAARVIFNRFGSAIAFKPTISTVVSPETLERQAEAGGSMDLYEVEGPDRAELLQDLGEFQLAVTLFNGMLENNCSENASRMSAMENSTKNASDMLSRLTLSYNRSRQASITTELTEIISGAAALEG